MKATIDANDLFNALKRVKAASASPKRDRYRNDEHRAGKYNGLPILTHVRLEAVETTLAGRLKLTCTDLHVADDTTIFAWECEAGAFCVPVRLLRDIAFRLCEINEPVTLRVDEAAIEPHPFARPGDRRYHGKPPTPRRALIITCGECEFRLVGLPVSDFPVTDTLPRLERPDGAQAVEAPCAGQHKLGCSDCAAARVSEKRAAISERRASAKAAKRDPRELFLTPSGAQSRVAARNKAKVARRAATAARSEVPLVEF